MSQESIEFVRKPLRVRERSRRTLDQRFSLRFPRLAAAYFGLIFRLPPGSRLRQAALWRAARLALEAYNRRDLDASLIGYHPEFEIFPARAWVEAGLVEPCYHRSEGYRKYVAIWDEVWGTDSYLRPVELIDLGERFVILTQAPMRARERCPAHRGVCACLDVGGRQDRPPAGVLPPCRGPRNRGAGGVGDVAGERGGGPPAIRGPRRE